MIISLKCSYFNTSNVTIQRVLAYRCILWNFISIHLMLLFNSYTVLRTKAIFNISIHLMLLFNSETTIQTGLQKFISIHLMLLFNRSRELSGIQRQHFNTSNVTIQLAANSYSIHNSFMSFSCFSFFSSTVSCYMVQSTYLIWKWRRSL